MWQAAIQHMMSSPGQFQKIVQAFANQQPIHPNISNPVDPAAAIPNHTAVAAYEPSPPDYSRWFSPPPPSTSSSVSPPLLAPVHDENAPLHLLMDESNRLQKSYRDASEIDADMDMLQTSINSLIQNLGIDPTSIVPTPEDALPAPTPVHPGMNGPHAVNGFANALPPDSFSQGLHSLDPHGADMSQPDYLLDSLLSQIGDGSAAGGADGMAGAGLGGLDYPDITDHYDHSARIDGTAIEDASTEQLTAFLDEASGVDAAPGVGVGVARSPKVATTHQKRKSDAVDLDLPMPVSLDGGGGGGGGGAGGGTGKKMKRKR